jgi:hypothetical protein
VGVGGNPLVISREAFKVNARHSTVIVLADASLS